MEESTYKYIYPMFWHFINRYDEDFGLDYKTQEDYWKEYANDSYSLVSTSKEEKEKGEFWNKISNKDFIKALNQEMNTILELSDEEFGKMKREVDKFATYFVWTLKTKNDYASWFKNIMNFLDQSK